jgi:hypothetical protein
MVKGVEPPAIWSQGLPDGSLTGEDQDMLEDVAPGAGQGEGQQSQGEPEKKEPLGVFRVLSH